jgi:hypothetical protein
VRKFDLISGYKDHDEVMHFSLRTRGCGCCADDISDEEIGERHIRDLEQSLKDEYDRQKKLIKKWKEIHKARKR